MSSENWIEAFERAYDSSINEEDTSIKEEGQPSVKAEAQSTESFDSMEAFNRAYEESMVSLQNDQEATTEEESFFDRVFGEPYKRAVQRQVATFERALGAPSLQQQMQDPAALEEAYRQSTNIPSILLQTATTPISLGFDVISETIVLGAEGAFSLVPEEGQKWAFDQLNQLLSSKEGQIALAYASEGAEAWAEFEKSNPNLVADLKSFFDLGAATSITREVTKDLIPIKLERVGMRNETKPLAGQDKDIYNIIYKEEKKTPQQVAQTTDPQGLSGRQEVLATAEELEAVDILKGLGVSGNRTMQENANTVRNRLEELDVALEKLARRTGTAATNQQTRASVQRVAQLVREEMDTLIQTNPDLFGSKSAREQVSRLFQEFVVMLEDQGGSAQGIINARRMFDERMGRMGIDLSGDKLNASFLSATAVRTAANKALFELVPEAEKIFEAKSKLIPILNKLDRKASKEATGSVGRYIQELGLDKLVGDTVQSKLLNGFLALGLSVAASPYYLIKRAMKRPLPAKGRAKVAYVLRDIKQEIEKGLKSIKDPVKRNLLLKEKAGVYTALQSAAKVIEQEMERQDAVYE